MAAILKIIALLLLPLLGHFTAVQAHGKSCEFYSSNGVTCEVCRIVIATLDAIITDPENELELANLLDSVCAQMPAYFVEECHFMVCTYYDQLINVAVSEFVDPTKLCTFLTLCP